MGTFSDPERDGQATDRHAARAERQRWLDETLELQAGRVGFRQMRDAGYDRQTIARMRKSGKLIVDCEPGSKAWRDTRGRRDDNGDAVRPAPLTRRVYRAPGSSQHLDGRRWAGLLSAPRAGALDHVSSCELLRLDTFPGEPIHVLVEGAGWDAPQGVKSHRTRSLPVGDLTQVRGITCTKTARALLSAAPDLEEQVLRDLLDTAVRLGHYDGDHTVDVMDRFGTHPGYVPLAGAVGALDATSGTFRSIFERRTMRLIEKSTLIPPPVVNVLLEGFRPDLRFIGTRAIIECDGRDYHRSPAQIIADDEREQRLEALGYVFLRLRWDQVVYDADRTLALIERFVLDNSVPPVPR